MANWRSILRSEFDAETGSFILQLRCDNTWDRDAFSRVVHAMKSCCIELASTDSLDRWIADGFWEIEHIARDWVSRSVPTLTSYHESALDLLHELAYWYFRGESPAGPDGDDNLFPLTLPD